MTTHSASAIPKPSFPAPRRRSSIGQAAAANSESPPSPAPTDTRPGAAELSPPASPVAEAQPAPPKASPVGSTAEPPTSTAGRERSRRGAKQSAATSPSATTASKRPVASKDILLSVPEDLKQRMVNTITWTQPHTGIGQQQKFIRKAINELCDRLETAFNSGNPFPEPAIPDDH